MMMCRLINRMTSCCSSGVGVCRLSRICWQKVEKSASIREVASGTAFLLLKQMQTLLEQATLLVEHTLALG